MSLQEFFILHDAMRPRDQMNDYAGTLTKEDCADLYELMAA